MSVVNIVIPFALITWGEQTIDSSLATILNATVPLFVIVLAPLFLGDEPITVNRVVGLAVGFAGVVVLFAPDLVNVGDGDLSGELALIGSSVSYAAGNVYARRNVRGLRPMIPAFFQVGFALLIATGLALLIERPIGRVVPAPEAWIAVVWLGILGSGFAYLAYFRLLRDWGATRTSLVAYLLPVVGISLGALAGEPVTLPRLAGTGLIIGGVALVNSRYGARPLLGRNRSVSAES
jgi:drug/metabolite transporter (DMT)-like permease